MKTSEVINIGSKILKNRNIISHKIDAEIILSHVLKISREKLLINEQAISYTDLKRFKKIISRRLKKEKERSSDRRSQIGSGDRSERIRTYNFPQGRVTDHRINLTLHKLDEFLKGEIHEEMNENLRLKDQDLKLKSLT